MGYCNFPNIDSSMKKISRPGRTFLDDLFSIDERILSAEWSAKPRGLRELVLGMRM